MRLRYFLVTILIFVAFCNGASADVIIKGDDNNSNRSSKAPRPPSIPPPNIAQIHDTVKTKNITTIFITDEDRLICKEWGEEIRMFPLFNKPNYLANFFFDHYIVNPSVHFRVMVHCHASVQAFIYVVEQMNLFDQKREEYAFHELGLSKAEIDTLRQPDTELYNKYREISNRAVLWFELWDEDLELEFDKMGLMETMIDDEKSGDVIIHGFVQDHFYQLPMAIPTNILDEKDVIKFDILNPDSVEVFTTVGVRLRIDGKEHAYRDTIKATCDIGNLVDCTILARIRNPACPLLLNINSSLNCEEIWNFMTYLFKSHLYAVYFGVIPRETYPPGTFPWTMQAVSLQISHCLSHPTIIP
jgi:hypothetical protein